MQAQESDSREKNEKEKKSKFQIIGSGNIGFAIVKSDLEPTYNLNTNGGEILLNYKFSDKNGVAIGFGHTELTGNGFNSVGNFYHQRSFIKIPLLYTMEYQIAEKIKYLSNFGFYAQTIFKDEYQFLNNTEKSIYSGWNFGAEASIGIVFEVSEKFSAGINFSGQFDFTKLKTNKNQIINDQQRIESQNSLGLLLLFEL
jgi:hypothetical protein